MTVNLRAYALQVSLFYPRATCVWRVVFNAIPAAAQAMPGQTYRREISILGGSPLSVTAPAEYSEAFRDCL
jgi:hypothetical protein